MRSSHRDALAFIEQAVQANTDECLEWPFTKLPKGYPKIQMDGRKLTVTHLVLERMGAERPAPPRDQALHSCDNPPCVNPRHLRWGSAKENSLDMVQRKRQRNGVATGHQHPASVLSPALLTDLLRAYKAGEGGYVVLARRFGVSRATVQRAVRGITYT